MKLRNAIFQSVCAFGIVAGIVFAGVVKSPLAQQFLWSYPFAGVQPQNTIDFLNPPISYTPQFGNAVTPGGNLNPVSNVAIGSVAYGSVGNATTDAAAARARMPLIATCVRTKRATRAVNAQSSRTLCRALGST